MHIALLSDFETQYGGAAICASRLSEALLDSGQQVTRLVAYADGQSHRWKTVPVTPSHLARIYQQFISASPSEANSRDEQKRNLARHLRRFRPEVISVHNMHGALLNGWTIELLSICLEFAPVVWTLHDMWSMTGRCAFAYDCIKYISGCDAACPTPDEYPALAPERISTAYLQRESFFQKSEHVVAVCPSRWLENTARQGLWTGKRLEVIPYGLPLEIYIPQQKSMAREKLGIAAHGLVVLLAGFNLDDRRKGVQLFVEALGKLPAQPLTVLSFGSGSVQIDLPGVAVHNFGYIADEHKKALIYSSADIFLHPAFADNLPNTVMEAISCGTPVIAFSVGGLPELVRPGETGWLAGEVSVIALAGCLEAAISDISSGVDISQRCREVAEQEYSSELQAQRYLRLFASVQ